MIVFENYSLAAFNTFGVDHKCRYFAKINHTAQLEELIATYPEPFILGGGSNILFTMDLDKLVIKNELPGRQILDENEEQIILKIGSGENWHEIVSWTVSQGWGGLENLALIPGSVGAAPVQNIGAYGTEIKDVIFEVEALDLQTKIVERFSKTALDFGYRDSLFKKPENKGRYFILSISMQLKKNSIPNEGYADIQKKLNERNIRKPQIEDIYQAVIDIRTQKLPDPKLIGNAGSFFKNPVITQAQYDSLKNILESLPAYPVDHNFVKIPAGYLIEKAGWKGKSIGQVACYEKQALVIINKGAANGKEILQFAKMIQEDIRLKFKIHLEMEIQIV